MTINKIGSSKRRQQQSDREHLLENQNPNGRSDSSKSSEAARLAQQLASQNSWADTYVPHTPSSSMTPETSTVIGDEREVLHDQQDRADDPPPAYEDATHNLPELAGEPSGPRRSIPNLVRSPPDIESEEQIESPDERQHLLDMQRLEAAERPSRKGAKRRGCVSRRREKRNRRRFKIIFFSVILILLCLLLMSQQNVINFSKKFEKPEIPIPGRNYTRHETSQSISGTFTFYDVLDLSTESGSISITLDPQPGDKPAVLRLSAKSGSVRVDILDTYKDSLKQSNIVQRPWNTEIRTKSGSIKVRLPIGGGSTTLFETTSSSITARLYAANLGPQDETSYISTESASGSQDISIENMLGSSLPITNLAGKLHVSGSATQKLSLPQTWQGLIHASVAGSGAVKVQGEGLEFQRQGDKEMYAWRGKGEAIQMKTDGSAGIKVDCSSSS